MTFVTSPLSERLWAAHREAGRPVPSVSEDDVLDFLVAEAMAHKMAKLREKAQTDAQKPTERQSALEQLKAALKGKA